MTDDDRDRLRARGIGITNIVRRATAKAAELSDDELRAGGVELAATVRRTAPRVVAIAGITAYRTAFGQRKAAPGRQPEPLEGAELGWCPTRAGSTPTRPSHTLARRRTARPRGPRASL